MRRLACILQLGLVLFIGCGQATYDERLENRISELNKPPPAAAEGDSDNGDGEDTTDEDQEASAEEDAEEENS